MLTQLQSLSVAVDGRYATNTELQFMSDYVLTFDLRLSIYLKLQAEESAIIDEVETKLKVMDPQLLIRAGVDLSEKCRNDVVRVLRLSATTMLIDDMDRFKERFLYWFQTLMKAFKNQRNCDVTYQLLLEVVKTRLTKAEADLFSPILELNRIMLGLN